MEANDKPVFFAMLTGTAELHGRELSEAVLGIYWSALKQFPLQDLERAFSACVTNPDTGQFLPKPADIVRMLTGSSQTQALIAWASVERAVRTVGAWQSVVFSDPIIHAVIRDMGGWVALCHIAVDEFPFRAKEFENRYRGYVLDPPKEYPRSLTGLAETNNAREGHAIAPPVVIGPRDKARDTYRNGVLPQQSGPQITRGPEAMSGSVVRALPPPASESAEDSSPPGDRTGAMTRIMGLLEGASRRVEEPPRPEPFRPDPKRRAELRLKLEDLVAPRREAS